MMIPMNYFLFSSIDTCRDLCRLFDYQRCTLLIGNHDATGRVRYFPPLLFTPLYQTLSVLLTYLQMDSSTTARDIFYINIR